MPIRGEGLINIEEGQDAQTHKTVYVLHPNCAIEEMWLLRCPVFLSVLFGFGVSKKVYAYAYIHILFELFDLMTREQRKGVMSDDIQMCCYLYLISYWYFMSVYTCLVVSAIIVTLVHDIGHRTCRCSPYIYIYLVYLSSMFLLLFFVVRFIFILDELSGRI